MPTPHRGPTSWYSDSARRSGASELLWPSDQLEPNALCNAEIERKAIFGLGLLILRANEC
jgi:hypothetical protein